MGIKQGPVTNPLQDMDTSSSEERTNHTSSSPSISGKSKRGRNAVRDNSSTNSCSMNTGRTCLLLFYSTLVVFFSGNIASEALATSFYSPVSNTITASSSRSNTAGLGLSTFARLSSLQTRGGSLSPSSRNTATSTAVSKGTTQWSASTSTPERDGNEEGSSSSTTNGEQKDIPGSKVVVNGFFNGAVNGNNMEKIGGSLMSDEGGEKKLIPCSYIAETHLPTDVGHFRLRAYRVDEVFESMKANQFMGTEPCVIYAKDKPPFGGNGVGSGVEVPVRVHDQCFTSEVFRSKRCDCKEQLKMALEFVQENGGAIIYLQQEGRGIGIANKVAAYALQDGGMDTVDANLHLGLPEDCRQYGVVPYILKDMGISSIKLITNNPRKIRRLRALGVDVRGTIPMVVPEPTEFNRAYLQAKKDRMNHLNFDKMLSTNGGTSPRNGKNNVMSPRNGKTNGMMAPKKRKEQQQQQQQKKKMEEPIAADYINDGEEMAAAAITIALEEDVTQDDDEAQAGVTASDDGYCFGRESVEQAIAAVARGELVVVVDDMERENEGDFIMAADLATPETMATIIRYSSGVICVGMEDERMKELDLPPMMTNNQDPKGTAFSVTVDAAPHHGITTGISAKERALTMKVIADPKSGPQDLVRPGHIFPLRAREGGTLTRDGHTEASVDLARLAGRDPSGILCEIVSEENPTEMARLPELKRFSRKHGFVLTSIVDIAQYRRDTEDI